jgi:hypothetical protein
MRGLGTLCFAVNVCVLLVSAMVMPVSHLDTSAPAASSEAAATAHEAETPDIGDLECCQLPSHLPVLRYQ